MSSSGVRVRAALADPSLDVMNFLNEAVSRYPDAISFAPGRPKESHFHVEDSLRWITAYVNHTARIEGIEHEAAFNSLGQYGRTNGLIHRIIAEHLRLDEGIEADPTSIMVANGAQEIMAMLVLGMFEPATDVLLVSDPGYIGMSGLARAVGVEVYPVPLGREGLEIAAVKSAIRNVRNSGKIPRALYDNPSFNNPQGTCLALRVREALLDLIEREDLLFFEDTAYNAFSFDDQTPPSIKSLDHSGRVVYLGSFSKTLFPGARIGFAVVDQKTIKGEPLIGELSKVKSLLTINTPPLTQALVGGALLSNGGSIKPIIARKLPQYRKNRDRLLDSLDRHLGTAKGVKWNRPSGGFFATLTLPFEFDADSLEECASGYGVVCCPMMFFALSPGWERQVRLSFSYVNEDEIEEGVKRLASFLRSRMA